VRSESIMTHASHTRAGGHRLEYRLSGGDGTAGRPTLVFLHQGLGSISMWRDAPDRLAAMTGCAVLVYSRYGHGQSDVVNEPRRADFLIVEGRDVLPELLRALALDDVLLVGHSDGATAALAYLAAGHPARGAVVVAPHVFDEPRTLQAIEGHVATWGRDGLRERLARHHRDADAMFHAWADVWRAPAMRGWTMLPELANIRVPVLAIQGVEDTHGTMAQIECIAAASRGPVELLKLRGCGHDPFRERPDETLAACAAFVARCGAPRAAPPGRPA
jgi:pimeloyl-ACP methyl ester carboxylesterase